VAPVGGLVWLEEMPMVAAIPSTAAVAHMPPTRLMLTLRLRWTRAHDPNGRQDHSHVLVDRRRIFQKRSDTIQASRDGQRHINFLVMAPSIPFQARLRIGATGTDQSNPINEEHPIVEWALLLGYVSPVSLLAWVIIPQ
jgi:hypothetical protein